MYFVTILRIGNTNTAYSLPVSREIPKVTAALNTVHANTLTSLFCRNCFIVYMIEYKNYLYLMIDMMTPIAITTIPNTLATALNSSLVTYLFSKSSNFCISLENQSSTFPSILSMRDFRSLIAKSVIILQVSQEVKALLLFLFPLLLRSLLQS